MNGFDPITLAVINNSLEEVVEEMDYTFERAAFSDIISEGMDRASGIYDPSSGEVIVQGKRALLLFIGIMQFAVQSVLRRAREFTPGDIYAMNDPYLGGSHLMDVKMISPFFYRDQLWGFLANTGHWPDIGGYAAGGFAASATEIYQEGLRITPIKLAENGRLREDVADLLLANVRGSQERWGDMQAQVHALEIGAQRLRELLDKHGDATVRQALHELRERSEVQMRFYIEGIPDGVYSFEDYIDSDGHDEGSLCIHLDLTVKGSNLHFDFSKSSPACRGPLNSALSASVSACYVAIKHIFPDVPINAGCFRPITFNIPSSTFLHAVPPRALSAVSEVTQRIVDVVFGALSQAIPDRVYAAAYSTTNNLSLGGIDPERGPYVMYSYLGGGYGGSRESDGFTNGTATISIARTTPIEIMEKRYPLFFLQYAIREDSAGEGKRRGGFGVVWEAKLLRGEARVALMGDRAKYVPWGICGGNAAKGTEVVFTTRRGPFVFPHVTKGDGLVLQAGDVILRRTPGGGGYGDPRERAQEDILDDLRNGYISRGPLE